MAQTPQDWPWWLREHTPRLLLFARQQTRSESDARDVLQEALRDCWRADPETPPAPALAFRCIRHRAIDLARAAQRRSVRELAAAPVDEMHFDIAPEDRERDEELAAAVANLPPDQRAVLTLKIWGNLTFAEVAEVLAISPNTAASRYRLALTALRQRLTPLLA